MVIVQIGCNDCQDSVKDFIFARQNEIQRFIVIDALPKAIEAAKQTYSFLGQKLFPVISAVGLYNGVIPFYCPEDENGSIHASASAEHVFNHQHERVKISCAACLRLENILTSFDLFKVDRLYLDAEGLDVEILLALDLKKFNIGFIEYEFCHADGTFEDGLKGKLLREKLQSLGYKIHQSDQYNLTAQK